MSPTSKNQGSSDHTRSPNQNQQKQANQGTGQRTGAGKEGQDRKAASGNDRDRKPSQGTTGKSRP